MSKQTLDGKWKISYQRWQRAVYMIEELRKSGMSLTEISRAVKGSGDTPGWADRAREHRSIVHEKDMKALIELRRARLQNESAGGNGAMETRTSGTRIPAEQQREFIEILGQLRDRGWTWDEIGATCGLKGSSLCSTYGRGHGGNREALEALRATMDAIERAAEAKAQTQASEPQTPEGEPDTKRTYREREVAPGWVIPKGEVGQRAATLKLESFEERVEATQMAVRVLLDHLEMLGASVPAFGTSGIEECIEAVKEVQNKLS